MTIACNSAVEKSLVEKFSIVDAIAVPRQKMGVESDREGFRYPVPVLNPVTRKFESDRTVILGRDVDPSSDDRVAETLLMACLDMYSKAEHNPDDGLHDVSWEHYWNIIHEMEAGSGAPNMLATLSKLRYRYEIEYLIYIIMCNIKTPLLNIVDQHAEQVLTGRCRERCWMAVLLTMFTEDPWNEAALINVMKHVDSNLRWILKVFWTAYMIQPMPDPIFQTTIAGVIFRRWDFDFWRPLGMDTEWSAVIKSNRVELPIRRMKRFLAKQESDGDGEWIYLEVNTQGEILDTPENREKGGWRKDFTEEEEERWINEQRSQAWMSCAPPSDRWNARKFEYSYQKRYPMVVRMVCAWAEASKRVFLTVCLRLSLKAKRAGVA
ncbi:hypothetical protein FRC17_008854 [Serendipita sp. 399]|nr:hypothetical protein FRC17_008854 [Serendipita sp. 399]